MKKERKSIWLVTREYAGVAEAGGVKNVARSLAEGLARKGVSVRVFIPRYACVPQSGDCLFSSAVPVLSMVHGVSFHTIQINGVSLVLIDSQIFSEKDGVYVYSDREARMTQGVVRGQGHNDMDIMNLVHQRSVLEYGRLSETVPDIIHCQDAHTAILPAIARNDSRYREIYSTTSFVVTIHNAGPGYRQLVPGIDRAEDLTGLSADVLTAGMFNGNLEPFLLASEFAHLTTVSPWYADELTSHHYSAMTEGLSAEFERRGTHITGIVNGIDYHRYDPSDTACSLLPFAYDPLNDDFDGKYRARAYFVQNLESLANTANIVCHGSFALTEKNVWFVYQGRIVWQKGLDVFVNAAREVLETIPSARFIVLGQGDPLLEKSLMNISEEFPGSFVYLQGYERSLARLSVAAADFLVLPSKFEPCGLEDYIGQIFATIPVANAVGGLQKIQDGINGYVYHTGLSDNAAAILADRLTSLSEPVLVASGEGAAAVPHYRQMLSRAATQVKEESNWDSIIDDCYFPFYCKIISPTC